MTHELHLSREGEKEMEALIKEKEKYNRDVTLLIPHAPPFQTRCSSTPCVTCTSIQR